MNDTEARLDRIERLLSDLLHYVGVMLEEAEAVLGSGTYEARTWNERAIEEARYEVEHLKGLLRSPPAP